MNMPANKSKIVPGLDQGPRATGLIMRLLVIISLALTACTPTYLPEQELQTYIRDSEPTDLLIAQELGGEVADSFTQLTELRKKYQNYDYFILSLSKDDKEALYKADRGYDQFSELVQTLSFRMASYVNMTTAGKDTIEVADYVFPRTYGMGGATSLMFVFNKEETNGDEWVQFNLKEFGMGLGNKNFRFRREDLDNVPKIDFRVIRNKTGLES